MFENLMSFIYGLFTKFEQLNYGYINDELTTNWNNDISINDITNRGWKIKMDEVKKNKNGWSQTWSSVQANK